MEKHKLYGYWHKYRRISLIILVAGFIFFSLTSILALRNNNLTMLKLKEKVVQVDAQGGDVEKALIELRDFVFSHMNTTMRPANTTEPPLQLVSSYNRYIEQQQAKLTTAGQSDMYTAAQANCEREYPTIAERVNCIQLFVAENGGALAEINFPSKDLYTFDFASPRWTPDLAGISLVLAVIFFVLLVLRLVTGFFVKAYLG